MRQIESSSDIIDKQSNIVVMAQDLDIGHSEKTVITNVNFSLKVGKTLALVGANGSGKTTLLKTIAGLIPPISGNIKVFNEQPLSNPTKIAYLGQIHSANFILPLRAYDIVRMARFAAHGLLGRMTANDEKAIHEAMAIMDILDLANTPLNAMSGGQRQRVFLAQAFAKNADLILLDEPAANLDANAREMYRVYLHKLTLYKKTIILTTHDIAEAAECDWIMLLANKVVAYGKSPEIFTKSALLDTFGTVGNYQDGKFVIVEREHGHDECH